MCEAAYRIVVDGLGVGRVIARPFVGPSGAYARTANRHDYAMPSPEPTLLDRLSDAGVPVIAIGKIADLFAGRGITRKSAHAVRRGRRGRRRGGDARGARRAHLRQPRGLRHEVRPSERRPGVRGQPRALRPAAAGDPVAQPRRTTCSSSPPTTATTRPRPARITRGSTCRCWPPAGSCRGRVDLGTRETFADLGPDRRGGLWRRPASARHQLPDKRMSLIRTQLEQRERDILAPQAAKSADSRGRQRPEAGRRHPPGVSARPRPRDPQQGVPPPEAQDAGVLRADRRSLPHAADAHARGVADRAHHRQGAAPARGADRGDRARARPGPHAVWPRRRARAERPDAGRVQPLRAEPARRRRARERPARAEPDLGSARRHRQALQGQARRPGRRRPRPALGDARGPDRARGRPHRLRQPRHRRRDSGRADEGIGLAGGGRGRRRAFLVRAHRAHGLGRGPGHAPASSFARSRCRPTFSTRC